MAALNIAQLECWIRIVLLAHPQIFLAVVAERHQLHVDCISSEPIGEQSILSIKFVIKYHDPVGIYSRAEDEKRRYGGNGHFLYRKRKKDDGRIKDKKQKREKL